jgi:hypothetical protein
MLSLLVEIFRRPFSACAEDFRFSPMKGATHFRLRNHYREGTAKRLLNSKSTLFVNGDGK